MLSENKPKFNIYQFLGEQVKPVFNRLRKWLWIPLGIALLLFGAGYWQESKKPTKYNALISYILEDEIVNDQGKNIGGGLLASLSGQSGSSNKAIMVDLGQTNKLVENTLLKRMKIEGKDEVLVNYYIKKFGYAGAFSEAVPYSENYKVGTDAHKDYMLRVFSRNVKLTLVSMLQESGILTLDFTSTDELFTKLFLDHHLKTISEFYIDKKLEKARNLVSITGRRRDSLLAILQGKTYSAAAIQDNSFGVVMRRAKVAETQINRDISILNNQYAESVIALNAAALDLERKRPFISLIDDVRMPLNADAPKPVKKGITWGILSLIVALAMMVGIILGMDFLKKQKLEFQNKTN